MKSSQNCKVSKALNSAHADIDVDSAHFWAHLNMSYIGFNIARGCLLYLKRASISMASVADPWDCFKPFAAAATRTELLASNK